MKTGFHVLFYLKSRPNRNGLHSIVARITIDGRSSSFHTHLNIAPKQWNQKRQRMTGRCEATSQINLALEKIRSSLTEKYTYYHILRQEPIHAVRLKELYLGINRTPPMLIAYFDNFNQSQNRIVGKGLSYSTHKKYLLTRKRLASFIFLEGKQEDILLENLDLSFILRFEHYLRDTFNMCNNSVEKLMRIFRRIVTFAVYNGLLTQNPFEYYKIKIDRVERPYLTQEELDRILHKRFTIRRLEQIKDIFIFCCYTGLSYIDAINLHSGNIEVRSDNNKWLVLKRQKTGIRQEIRLFRPAEEIIRKYHSETKDNHLLPICSNQKLNSYLKEIADCCRIHKAITFHTARHTFATTIALSNGMPIETLARALGHTNLRSTLIYARITDQKLIQDMDRLAVTLGI